MTEQALQGELRDYHRGGAQHGPETVAAADPDATR